MSQYRQGDLLLVRVAERPEGQAVPRIGGRIVLSDGDVVAGHAVVDPEATLRLTQRDGFFLDVAAPVGLFHPEHAAIELPPGIYAVHLQREFDPVEMGRRAHD